MGPSRPAPRAYRSDRRQAQARLTRRRVLAAATALFLGRGYTATTVRAVAEGAEVSVPTVEALFRTKAGLLKAAIDVAIAGDDEPVAMLHRDWAATALAATGARDFLTVCAEVLAAAQARSAGLVLAVFEGAGRDPALADLAAQLIAQRTATAGWVVDRLTALGPLRPGHPRDEAVDTVWLLMDPAVYERLTRHRGWTAARYARWFTDTAALLLMDTKDRSSA